MSPKWLSDARATQILGVVSSPKVVQERSSLTFWLEQVVEKRR